MSENDLVDNVNDSDIALNKFIESLERTIQFLEGSPNISYSGLQSSLRNTLGMDNHIYRLLLDVPVYKNVLNILEEVQNVIDTSAENRSQNPNLYAKDLTEIKEVYETEVLG